MKHNEQTAALKFICNLMTAPCPGKRITDEDEQVPEC